MKETLLTILQNLNGPKSALWEIELDKFSRGEPCWTDKSEEKEEQSEPPILHLLSSPNDIILPATDGKRTIVEASDVFTGYIDPDFSRWNTNVSGEKSGELPVSVYEMRRNATFEEMFTELSDDPNKLALPQDKIIVFCENHRSQLRTDGFATFFLFGDFFVAGVFFGHRGGLEVNFFSWFGDGVVWGGDDRRRLVIPQLGI